jgi:hypothetical protein
MQDHLCEIAAFHQMHGLTSAEIIEAKRRAEHAMQLTYLRHCHTQAV